MKLVKVLLSLSMLLMFTACGTTVEPNETPEVTTPEVTEPAKPEIVIPPTFADVAKDVTVETTDLKLMSVAGMDMWYNKVNVTIAGQSDIAGLVVRVYYYGNNKNVLTDSYDENLKYLELECSGQSEVYDVVGFYNPHVTRARAVIYSITLTDGTVLENVIEL